MPWTSSKEGTLPSLKNKSLEYREIFARVANAALDKGQTEEEAIQAGLAAAAANERRKARSVQKEKSVEIPAHLRAIFEAEPKIRQEIEKAEKTSKDIVSAKWDNRGRLTLTFSDGSRIVTDPVPVSENIEQYVSISTNPVFEYVQFNTDSEVVTQPGMLTWNQAEGTLDLGMNGGGVTQHIGLETYYRVKNQTGATLFNGSVVKAVGAVGNSGHILAAPAVATEGEPTFYILGIVTHDIPNGENGFTTNFGLVKGIDTTGSDVGQTWVDGDVLYVHPTIPGKLTKLAPEAPIPKIVVAMVVHAHRNGQLFVRPSISFGISELNDVSITSPQEGDVLQYDSTFRRWKNAQPGEISSPTGVFDSGTF